MYCDGNNGNLRGQIWTFLRDHSNITMMDNSFAAGTDWKLQFTHNLVESLWPRPTHVYVIPELIIMLCYDLKTKC